MSCRPPPWPTAAAGSPARWWSCATSPSATWPTSGASASTSRAAGCGGGAGWARGGGGAAEEKERRAPAGERHDAPIQPLAPARLMLTTFRDQLSDDRQRRLL